MAGPTLLEKTPGLAERICELARQGKTDKQIAELIGVTDRTLLNWKTDDVVFASYLKENKELADDLVELSTFKNARGYNYKEKTITDKGEIEMEKHQPPNATAQIFWLKNRRPEVWKDRVEVATEAVGIVQVVTQSGREDEFTR